MNHSVVARVVWSLLAIVLTEHSYAVTAGHIDDFEDGTTQSWQEGAGIGTPNPNPPTNVANGGPMGAGDNFLENVSTGGAGSGSKQIIFNTSANWTGDFDSEGVNVIHLDVQVDASSEGPLQLRLAFEGTNGARFASANAVLIPDDGNWYPVTLPLNEADMVQVAAGATFTQALAGVTEFRLVHRPGGPGFNASAYDGLVGYDNITSLSVSSFTGWLWETGAYNTGSPAELGEEYCFGQFQFGVDSDDHWTLNGSDACVGRVTTNDDPARAHMNYDQGTDTIPLVESYEARSTQPLVSAGGNLLELVGEDVDMGVGQGEERLATILAAPSNSDLLIFGGYDTLTNPNFVESFGFVDLLVKDSPEVRAARVASDLEGGWYISFFSRFISRNNVAVNVSQTGLRVLDLQPAGVCAFTEPLIIPDPEIFNNGDAFTAAQVDAAGGVDLTDRGVFAGATNRTRSACTYEIDTDGYLSVDFTSTDNTVNPPVDTAVNIKYVVSDDNNYLIHAPDPDGVEENSVSLAVGYRAPVALLPDSIDGTYLFYLNVTDHLSTGAGHSGVATGPQLFDLFGRGRITFDSLTAGTAPAGYLGDWYACDIDLVLSEADYQANGEPGLLQVTTQMELFSERQLIDCDYNLAADGSLLMNLVVNDPGEPLEEVLFAGYVNQNGEVISLIDFFSDIENPGSPVGNFKDLGSVRHILAMTYTGDLSGNEDGDEFTNLEEFQLPLPPPPPFTDLIALPSIGGSAAPDVGVVVEGASVHVHVRDGSTDALLSDVDFGTDPAYGILVVPDLGDAGSDAEIAMLGERPTGQIRAQVKDSATGGAVSNLFYGSQYSGIDMALVSDYGGGGLPELAVLGVNASNGIRVQTRDIATDTFLDNLFLGSQTTAKSVASVADVSGNGLPEIGMLSVVNASSQARLQVLDADTGLFYTNVWYGNIYAPVELITMPTINGGSAEEFVGLGINEVTGGIRVQIRDSGTAAILTNMFLGSANAPVDLAVVSDNNGNGFPEIAVLMETPAGNGIVKVHDSNTGLFIRNVFFNGLIDPVGIVTLPNYAGGPGDEIAVLGTNGGVKRVQIKDSGTNAQINAISFPE